MLSKARIKLIQSLHLTKNRRSAGLFTVEGTKIILELLRDQPHLIDTIYATDTWRFAHSDLLEAHIGIHVEAATDTELKAASLLQSTPPVLALVRIPTHTTTAAQLTARLQQSPTLVPILTGIQDPGNVGTILRTADWFGIPTLITTTDTADLYNPKTLQASMGAFLRLQVCRLTDEETLALFADNPQLPRIGTVLSGNSLYTTPLPAAGFLLIGNEGQGIPAHFLDTLTLRVKIPAYGNTESLNAAAATAIVLSDWRRTQP